MNLIGVKYYKPARVSEYEALFLADDLFDAFNFHVQEQADAKILALNNIFNVLCYDTEVLKAGYENDVQAYGGLSKYANDFIQEVQHCIGADICSMDKKAHLQDYVQEMIFFNDYPDLFELGHFPCIKID